MEDASMSKRSQPLGLVMPLTLAQQRDIIKADLLGKFQREDWHGVMDCAADLREHDAQVRGYLAGETSAK
jgi:hypothetical protein